jgi:hypothetical protein
MLLHFWPGCESINWKENTFQPKFGQKWTKNISNVRLLIFPFPNFSRFFKHPSISLRPEASIAPALQIFLKFS